jgi:CrcB protein
MWRELVGIALAGALGTLARYGLSGIVQNLCGEEFPWGTLAVNCLGCFLFGLVWSLAESRILISGQARFVILVGFMGAFTTFSTFAFETGEQLRDAEWLIASGNLLAHVVLGIGLFLLGGAIARSL